MSGIDPKALRTLQSSLNRHIDALLTSVEAEGPQSDAARREAQRQVHAAAVNLTYLTSNPFAEVYRLGMQPTINVAIRTAIDLNLFEIVSSEETLDSLVRKTGADPKLILRVVRLLVAIKFFNEPEAGTYTSTPISRALTRPAVRDWIKTSFDSLLPIWQRIPEFIRSNSLRDITDLDNNPTLQIYGANFFDALAQDPQREADFASAMSLSDQTPYATPPYPFKEAITLLNGRAQSLNRDFVFVVDVGGGHGQYLHALLGSHPDMPGRKILQDLPSTLSSLKPQGNTTAFEVMPHDFFKPQPVYNAKFYILRQILHDWPDDSCVQILSQIRPAMQSGFSKLLIVTFVLPTSGVSLREAMLDLNMWTCCGRERTEPEWAELLGRAGFKIGKIVRAAMGPLATIEAVRDDETEVSGGEGAGTKASKLVSKL